MYLQYHGDACVRISSKVAGADVVVLCDPYDAKTTKLKALRPSTVDVICITGEVPPSVSEGPFVINGPGEYEIHGVAVVGIAAGKRTIYRISAEGIVIAHLGNLSAKFDDATLERLGEIDVVLLPVGGKTKSSESTSSEGVLATKQAIEVIEQLEPRIVVPIQYALADAELPYEAVTSFCKEYGCDPASAESKLKITKSDLPQDSMQIALLAVE
jgi:hypothetical protein